MDYSIGIVTYVERFNKSFRQLALDLTKYFPDVERNAIINGFPDQIKQLKYLKEVTPFLQKCGFKHVLTYEKHQALAKGWNQLIIMSTAPRIMILNDDCQIGPNFRKEFESQCGDHEWLFLNCSYSHFFTSKSVVKKIGWFDERFLGIGHEDGDFSRRCSLLNYPYDISIDCPSLKNLQIAEEHVSFTENGKKRNGNYSMYNEWFFKKKWKHADHLKKGYTLILIRHLKEYRNVPPGKGSFCKLKRGMETPLFYPLEILD
jgi:hypothetical protein